MSRNAVRRVATEHPTIVRLGRVGWLAKGVVYVLAGVLALFVVSRSYGWSSASSSSREASPTGAIKEVAQSGGGPLLLFGLAIGLFLYVAWRLTTALLPGSTDAEGIAKRIGYGVSAIIYTTFAVTAISLARSSTAKANGNETVTDITSRLMQHGAGRWLVGITGVVVIGTGLYRLAKGLTVDVTEDVDMNGMSADRARWTRRLGAVGEVGRGVAIGVIGFFLVRAAVMYTPSEATGLDGALRRIALESWGRVLVASVGVGLVAYGVFCILTFTRRRLQGA